MKISACLSRGALDACSNTKARKFSHTLLHLSKGAVILLAYLQKAGPWCGWNCLSTTQAATWHISCARVVFSLSTESTTFELSSKLVGIRLEGREGGRLEQCMAKRKAMHDSAGWLRRFPPPLTLHDGCSFCDPWSHCQGPNRTCTKRNFQLVKQMHRKPTRDEYQHQPGIFLDVFSKVLQNCNATKGWFKCGDSNYQE